MSPLDPEIPPAGEEIHLPGPTIIPLLLTVGITVALIGVTTTLWMVIAGGLLALGCVIRWIADTRRDVAELPVHDEH